MSYMFDFFISHSSATKEMARHIYYNSLTNGIQPWYDEALLNIGDRLEQELRNGIERSGGYLLLHCKAAMESKWVLYEMKIAESKSRSDPKFRIIVVRLDDEPLPEFWQQFLYLSWSNIDQSTSVLHLISDLMGCKPIIQISAAAVLSKTPSEIFVNLSNTIAEHTRNYVLYYLAHLKQLLSVVKSFGYEDELRDTISKVLQLTIFENIPSLQGGIFPIAPGVFEIMFANRMRIPPRVIIKGLPDRYKSKILLNTEISCRIAIIGACTFEPIEYPVPLSIVFDSEL